MKSLEESLRQAKARMIKDIQQARIVFTEETDEVITGLDIKMTPLHRNEARQTKCCNIAAITLSGTWESSSIESQPTVVGSIEEAKKALVDAKRLVADTVNNLEAQYGLTVRELSLMPNRIGENKRINLVATVKY